MNTTVFPRRPDLHLITFNRGSSSLKVGLFTVAGSSALRIGTGLLDLRQLPLQMLLDLQGEQFCLPISPPDTDQWRSVMADILQHLGARMRTSQLAGVVHRVVHGGDHFTGPAVIDESSLAAMALLVPFAPLHQPKSLQLIHALRQSRPGLRQMASFDTAFHVSQSPLIRRFAIPRRFYDEGVKRYGFHGLSYRCIASHLTQRYPALGAGKVVVAHLGSGASLCAMEAGLSRDTSMGFSTLDGVPMATRCGALDAGVLLHWLGAQGMTLSEVSQLLYEKSGLLGVSDWSADTRELLSSAKPEAREAIEIFALRIAGEVARLATTLGGLDGLVFTAGIGEHQPQVRAAVCQRLAWLGIRLNMAANDRNESCISAPGSLVTTLVIPTDEEQVMADEALPVLQAIRVSQPVAVAESV